MLRTADTAKSFLYRREERQNPYTGFMSFQHFRGEKLYSDIIVRPEAKMTETERVECYPVSADAEENGRAEGYYPDTSIVYIRILWKEFEPERGQYNYAFIEEILNQARSHGQSLIFRLMAHSTRACDDVPEWLKSLIPCPERPDGARVKDSPTDPLFMTLFLEAVRALGARFDSDPTFETIDISLPGSWGEGHNLHLFPDDTLRRITDTYLEAFPNTQLIAQAGRPELIRYAADRAAVGWRGDGLGEPKHTFERYPERISHISDVWKTSPVSFESYWWLGEWKRKGWDIDAIIEKTLEWHLSSFNAKSIPVPYEWQEKVDNWIARMGYHFMISRAEYPAAAAAGDTLEIRLNIENVGVAPIYKRIPLKLRLVCGEHTAEWISDTDIRTWLPGAHEETAQLTLPPALPAGEYKLEAAIEGNGHPFIRMCMDAETDGAWHRLGTIRIG